DEDHPAIAVPRLVPAAKQQLKFLLAPDQRRQSRRGRMERLEAALDSAFAQHLPGSHRLGKTLHLDRAKTPVFEQVTTQAARTRTDHKGIGVSKTLQARRQVRRLAHYRPLAHVALVPEIANDYQPGGDSDTNLEWARAAQPVGRFDER